MRVALNILGKTDDGLGTVIISMSHTFIHAVPKAQDIIRSIDMAGNPMVLRVLSVEYQADERHYPTHAAVINATEE